MRINQHNCGCIEYIAFSNIEQNKTHSRCKTNVFVTLSEQDVTEAASENSDNLSSIKLEIWLAMLSSIAISSLNKYLARRTK